MKKKTDLKLIILFIIIGLILAGFLVYRIKVDFAPKKEPEVVNKKVGSIDLYGYTLSENDTDLFKSTFKELETALDEMEINYEEYAKLISKLFVIDLYTINNKLTSTDIGGNEFLHKDLRENFNENMGSSLYKNVENNINGKREQTLPEVSSVEVVDISETKYGYNGIEYDGYIVSLKWQYKEDLGYQSEIKLTLIKDNDKLYIVKGE